MTTHEYGSEKKRTINQETGWEALVVGRPRNASHSVATHAPRAAQATHAQALELVLDELHLLRRRLMLVLGHQVGQLEAERAELEGRDRSSRTAGCVGTLERAVA